MKPFHGWHTADRPGRKFLNPLPSPKRLDELHTLKENKANRLKKPIEDPIFTPKQDNLRWSRFKETSPEEMFTTVRDKAFPFIKDLGKSISGEGGSTYSHHMKDATFMMPTPRVLAIASSEYLHTHHGDAIYKDAASRRRFNEGTFHDYDFDSTMLRIGSMNMLLHGVENPDIRYKDSLAESDEDDSEKYTLLLANPPFAGSLDYESTAKDLQRIVKTKKTELLFMALFLRILQTGGRAAVIVPDGVLFGSSNAHQQIRKLLVEDQKLQAVISMPSGVFKPYAGVSTAFLLFTKTNSGGTDHVWFYDMQADGFSLDDKRTPQPDKSDLPDILKRWKNLAKEKSRARTDSSFLVPKAEIVANGYDLSLNPYKEVVHEVVDHDSPKKILTRLAKLEDEITKRREEKNWRGCLPNPM